MERIANLYSANTVLRNTFMLLGASLGFSAIMAYMAMILAVPYMGPWVTLIVYFVILWAVNHWQDSAVAVPLVFALTGWLGFTLGPILTFYMAAVPGGAGIIALSLGLTALDFLAMSGYAMYSGKDFSYMGGFLGTAILIAFIAGIVGMIFHLTFLSLIVSGAFVILSSAAILWQISEIINGGETNYVLATVTLYVSIYNIFVSLLQLFGILSKD